MRIIIAFLFLSVYSYGQTALGYDFRNNEIKKYDEDGTLKRFKNSETIFIFSNFIDKTQMEELLKKAWTVTPFKVISESEFNINNYLNGNYSFATYDRYGITFNRQKMQSAGSYNTTTRTSNMTPNNVYKSTQQVPSGSTQKNTFTNDQFLFFLINKNEYEKVREQRVKDNNFDIASFPRTFVSSFLLSSNRFLPVENPKSVEITKKNEKKYEDIIRRYYDIDFIYDNKIGYLYNNIQNMNNHITNQIKISFFSEPEVSSQISKLKTDTLYIPFDLYCLYTFKTLKEKYKDNFEKFKDDYDFPYNVLSSEDISNKIVNGEEFYYLRFNLIETEKLVQVVNSKTGEVIYSRRFSGMGPYQIPDKAIRDLNREVKRSI